MVNIIQAKANSRRRYVMGGYAKKRAPPKTFNSTTEYVVDFETLTSNTKRFKETQDTEIILWAARRRDAVDDGATLDYKEYQIKHSLYNKKSVRQEEYNNYNGFICGVNGETFIDFVLNQPKSTTFYFHNLKFDGSFIIPLLSARKELIQVHYTSDGTGLTQEGYTLNRNGQAELKPNYWDMFRDGKKIFYITLRKKGKDSYITLKFRCSYLMLSTSIKSLGYSLKGELFNNQPLLKFMNDEQHTEDFYNVEPVKSIKELPPDFFLYCLRDVEIARRSINNFHTVINGLPSIARYNKEKEEHNNKSKSNNRNGKYKGEMNIWGMSVSIAGLMRKLMHMVYIPYFQYSNKEFRESKKYRHIKATYGNFAKTDFETHQFFTEYHNLYNNKGGSKIFRGGFTQFNPRYQNRESLYTCGDSGKWDISSAYPFQMTKTLPFGKLINEKDFKLFYGDLTENEYYEYLIIPIKRAVAKENATYCATLPNFKMQFDPTGKNRYRYVLEQEEFTLSVLKQEWEELQHWYHFEIDESMHIQKYYMLAAPFLKEMSEELYSRKDYFNEQGLDAHKQGIKIAINSVYGSLGIRSAFDSLIYVDDDTLSCLIPATKIGITDKKQKTALIKYLPELLNTDLNAVRIREEKEITECWNIAAAATITALERVYLFKTIREIGASYFGYADTDSIIFVNLTKEAREKMERIEQHKPHPDLNIGRWECEYRSIKGFAAHKAKEYIQILEGKDKPVIKNAGFVFSDGNTKIKDLFVLTPQQRKTLNKNDIQQYYPNYEITEEFMNRIYKGDTLIINGSVFAESCKSGDIIIKKDKWTSLGVI